MELFSARYVGFFYIGAVPVVGESKEEEEVEGFLFSKLK